ncbi:hypothetical protein ANO11243_001280 [Dothideomycetidae sp. 11243]|nr:hypothetical protein ANO11243_001280 [fungal sp. No.11243]
MYKRAPLQAIGSGRTYLQQLSRPHRHTVRFYSTGKDENPTSTTSASPQQHKTEHESIWPEEKDATKANVPVAGSNESKSPAGDQVLDDDGYSIGLDAYRQSRRQRAAATSQKIQSLRTEPEQSAEQPEDTSLASSEQQQTQNVNNNPTQSKSSNKPAKRMHALDGVSEQEIAENRENSPSFQQDLATMEQFDREDVTPVVFDPATVTREEFLHSGRGGSTISAGNFEGVIQDRVKMLTEMRQDATRYAPDMARKMMRGGLVSFNSEQEKDAVVKEAKSYAHRLKKSASNVRKGLPDVISEYEFAPLADNMQTTIVDRYVRGKHADLAAKPHKSEVMNHVRASLSRNGTYLARDSAVFLRKVESIIAGSKSPPKEQRKAMKAKQ